MGNGGCGGVAVRCGDGALGLNDSIMADPPEGAASSRRDRVDGCGVRRLPASQRCGGELDGRADSSRSAATTSTGGCCRHRDGTVVASDGGRVRARAAWLDRSAREGGRAA